MHLHRGGQVAFARAAPEGVEERCGGVVAEGDSLARRLALQVLQMRERGGGLPRAHVGVDEPHIRLGGVAQLHGLLQDGQWITL